MVAILGVYLAEAPALSAVACDSVPALTLLSGSTPPFERPFEALRRREGEAILRACEPEPRAASREPLFASLKRFPQKNPKTGIMP